MLPAPSIGQGLCLGHPGEQLGVEEGVHEPAVQRLGKAVLPRCSWLDLRRGHGAALGSALEGVVSESRPFSDLMNTGAGWRLVTTSSTATTFVALQRGS